MTVDQGAGTNPGDAIAARMPATDRRGWAVLAGVALLIAAGVVWAVLGRAPETVSGSGMIVPVGGFVDVGTSLNGSVTEVLVSPGDDVAAGDPVATLKTEDGRVEPILATVSGTVATVVARQGGTTELGTPLLTLDPVTADRAVGFLPAAQAGKVRVGMPALVAVSSFPESQDGYITGTVRSVALLPATSARIQLLVGGNDQLPVFFTSSGPVVEVVVSLDTNPANPSGYAWTSGDGPNAEVATGELASVSVVVSDSSPLERIMG